MTMDFGWWYISEVSSVGTNVPLWCRYFDSGEKAVYVWGQEVYGNSAQFFCESKKNLFKKDKIFERNNCR